MHTPSQIMGWSAFFEDQLTPAEDNLVPARVTADLGQHYTCVDLVGESHSIPASSQTGIDRPAVGDWLLLRPGPHPILVRRLERRTTLVRQAVGRVSEAQVIAANLDTVFIVTAMGNDFNPRRLDRYLAAVCGGGAEPVIVISKSDLDLTNPGRYLSRLPPNVPGVLTSALLELGLDELAPWVQPGQSVGFVGSSGVGKSSLINALLGEDLIDTGGIRVRDERGQHTTTRREMHVLPNGAVLLDTPGMKELGLWNADGIVAAFSEIYALENQCHFRDCTHDNAPGCAVEAALERGELSLERLNSWLKLHGEAERQGKRREAVERRRRGRLEVKSRHKARERDRKRSARRERYARERGLAVDD